jgi:zinc transport system permease protein
MLEILGYEFMRNALLAGLLAGVACGIIGTLVVVNRLVFVSGGIAHAAYGGVGMALFLGVAPLIGIVGFTVITAVIMALVSLHAKHRADTVIGVLWALGMAIGVILIDLTPGYNVDLMSYLFGSILAVPTGDLWVMLAMDIVIVALVVYFYQGLLAMSFDEEFARVRGVPVQGLYFMLMILTAMSVVMIIRVVGLILVIALLTIPPFIAERFSKSLAGMMAVSILLSLIFVLSGLFLSYRFDITSGASIIVTASVVFFGILLYNRLRPSKIWSETGENQ